MLCLLVFTSLFVSSHTSSLTTQYYLDLINHHITQAENYEVPQNNSEFETSSDETTDFGQYDFVVVGAGSAGSVLATRLSEVDAWRILLLEAGGEEDDFSAIPGMFGYLQFSEMNWGYYTTPQTNCCLGMKGRMCTFPRGKALGGSSAINALLYVRGNPADYDKWEELGNVGWSYQEVLPYFIKSENSQVQGDPGYHGKGGFLGVESPNASPLFTTFVEANQELNQTVVDYNGAKQIGVAQCQNNVKHGKRQSTSVAFLDNARRRRNVRIVTRALATKITIDPETKKAQGVEFVTNGQKFRVVATKEVLVSAGAINSPQLLMLSGVGPKKHLQELGIDVIADLPVGENLMEHPHFPGLSFRTNRSLEAPSLEDSIEQYLNGLGPFTATAGGVGFLHAGDIPAEVPMLDYFLTPAFDGHSPITSRLYNYDHDLTDNYLNKLNSSTDICLNLILLHGKSRGRVTLKSSNPIDFPNIDLNFFSEREDVDNFIEGIEFLLDLAKTKPFQIINATFIDIGVCGGLKRFSREYWECAVRHMSKTLYHPCGTTAMGADGRRSVVDGSLRVHGVGSLRVVDAGVFPSTVSGPTNAAVIMVAEKIADVIKRDYGLEV